MSDYYSILKISQNATQEDIKKAYKKLAIQYHPDKNQGNPHSEELFKLINEAYQVLSDVHKKAAYDNMLLSNTHTSYTHTTNTKKRKNYRPRYHKRPVKYIFDKEYFRIQKIIVAIFILMVGSAYLWAYINHYNNEKRIEAELLFEKNSLDSLDNKITNHQYEEAVSYSFYLVKNYPLSFKYYKKKDSLMKLIDDKSNQFYAEKKYTEALRMYSIFKDYDTLQFENVLENVLECLTKTNQTDSSISLLKNMIRKNKTDIKSYFLLAKTFYSHNNFDSALQYINHAKSIFKNHLTKYYGEGFEFVIDPKKTPFLYFEVFLLRAKINFDLLDYEEAYSDANWALFLRKKYKEPYQIRIKAGIKSNQPFRICNDVEALIRLGEEDIDPVLYKRCLKNNI